MSDDLASRIEKGLKADDVENNEVALFHAVAFREDIILDLLKLLTQATGVTAITRAKCATSFAADVTALSVNFAIKSLFC